MESKKENKAKKPKGRMSAYTFFVQTCREEHRKKHPNENVNFTEFSKKCAERWKVPLIFIHLLEARLEINSLNIIYYMC